MVQTRFQIFILVGVAFILVVLLVPPEVESRIRNVRQQKPSTAKPGAKPTTAKPGGKPTTAKPGAKPTTGKPGQTTTASPDGANSTTPKPGSSTTTKPGGKPTTAKPGQKTTTTKTTDPDGEITTAPPLVTVTQIPILEVPGFTYLTQVTGQAFYISDEDASNADSHRGCRKLEETFPEWSFALANVDISDIPKISESLMSAGAEMVYVDGLVGTNSEGTKVQISNGLWGRYISHFEDDDSSKRRKRQTDTLITVASRHLDFDASEGHNIQKRNTFGGNKKNTNSTGKPKPGGNSTMKTTAKPGMNNGTKPNMTTTGKPGVTTQKPVKPGNNKTNPGGNMGNLTDDKPKDSKYITVLDTMYPWISDWTKVNPETCVDQSKCPPTTCEIVTPECTIETKPCQLKDAGNCEVVTGGGECSMDCEKCEIEKPQCYVQEPMCSIKKDRECIVQEPPCNIQTFPCTVTRPECVSRQPPCNAVANESPNCTVPEKCLTEQAITCVGQYKSCTEEQKVKHPEQCEMGPCQPWAICIKPEYCREEQIVCPPIEVFCPPEIVKCPPPIIKCEEPTVSCEEPEVYCGPPRVACTRPFVNCSAPKTNCPSLVTTCPNPEVECPPPKVTCPAPQVTCIPPANPCPVTHLPGDLCIEECKSNCNCFKLQRKGDEYVRQTCKCEDKYRYLCEAGKLKSAGGGGAPPSPKGGGAKPPAAKPAKGKGK